MKKIVIMIFLVILTGCSAPPIEYISEQEHYLDKSSGYELLWLSDQYLDIAGVINKKIVESNTESAIILLSEALKIVTQIRDLQVTPEYEKAKKHLYSATRFDSSSFVMDLDGAPREIYEDAMYDGMEQFFLFVQEMRKLGHDIKF